MFYFDYLLYMLPALLLGAVAQIMVKTTFSRYSKVMSKHGVTGASAAEAVLRASGVYGVGIDRVDGKLTDHYDPRNSRIYLSQSVYASESVAAVGVAAHEAGHAVQHSEEYAPLKIRSAIIPVCNFGAKVGPILIIISFIISYTAFSTGTDILYYTGLVLFSTAALFQLVTLPVEFNASKRAIAALEESGTLGADELKGARRVLKAAAMTYVAALFTSVLQILYYASRFRGDRR